MIILKSERELEYMRVAGRKLAQVLKSLKALIAPGITTKEIDLFAGNEIVQAGGKVAFLGYNGFPGNICISLNQEVVHGIAGPRKLASGDIVSIDIGLKYQGYYADMAGTFPVGEVEPECLHLMEVTRKSLLDGIEKACPDNRLFDISAAVQRRAEGEGFSVVRDFVGHGIGTGLHEDPQIPNFGQAGTGVPLRAGMVLAIEPMINLGSPEVRVLEDDWTVVTVDGKPSAHFEHTVAVTEAGPEILTA